MAKEKLLVIKEAKITNNCPECFNQDMTLSFSQRHMYSKLYHRTTAEVQYQIKCNKCDSIIYPVKWTEDIEKTFDYYQKTVKPESAKTRFSVLFYVIIIGVLLLLGALAYLYLEGFIKV